MTNIDMLSSDLDKKVRLTSSECEKEWAVVGKEPGLRKWRIEKFKVVASPREQLTTFYSGDAYIVCNSYKNAKGTLGHDIHFWLGEHCSQDERGVAAYKTQELDTFLGCGPTEHREVQGFESRLFLSYFKEIRVLEGGIDSGFNRVKPQDYKPRLLHVKGTAKTVSVRQVPCVAGSVNSGDVFILDAGLKIYQFQGKECGGAERAKASTVSRSLDDERGGKAEVIVFDEAEPNHPPEWVALVGKGPYKAASEGGSDKATSDIRVLFKVSDASGKLVFEKIAEGQAIKRTMISTNDAFILQSGFEIYVWVGLKASESERKNAFLFAQQYVRDNKLPESVPIHRLLEGGENEMFNEAFH